MRRNGDEEKGCGKCGERKRERGRGDRERVAGGVGWGGDIDGGRDGV